MTDPERPVRFAQRPYTDPEGLFTMEVPAGWLIDESGRGGARLALLHPAADAAFRANVNVIAENPAGVAPANYLAHSLNQLRQAGAPVEVAFEEPAPQAGGRLCEWVISLGPCPVRVRQVIVPVAGTAFVVTATASLADFERHRADIERALGSFALAAVTN